MPSFITTVVQSALLKASANLLVQIISHRHTGSSKLDVDWQRVAEFALHGLIQSPVNWYWQQFLEATFPSFATPTTDKDKRGQAAAKGSRSTDEHGGSLGSLPPSRSVNKVNVALKLLVDMTVGLPLMNMLFLVCTNMPRQQDLSSVWQAAQQQILGIVFAAWKLWPFVSLANFLWVPVEHRVLVASVVGFGWNMFLAFRTLVA